MSIHFHRRFISRNIISKTIDKHISILRLCITIHSDMAWFIILLFFIQYGGKCIDNYKYFAIGMDVVM